MALKKGETGFSVSLIMEGGKRGGKEEWMETGKCNETKKDGEARSSWPTLLCISWWQVGLIAFLLRQKEQKKCEFECSLKCKMEPRSYQLFNIHHPDIIMS